MSYWTAPVRQFLTEYRHESHRQLRHARSLTRISDSSLDEGNVYERSIRVYELEGKEFGDEGVFVLRVCAVVLVVRQIHSQVLVDYVEDLASQTQFRLEIMRTTGKNA